MSYATLQVPYEVIDGLVASALKEHRDILQAQLDAHAAGKSLHPDDVVKNMSLIKSMNEIIEYYGG